MQIIVTRNFDKHDPIGYLRLHDRIDIPPDHVFALGYTVLEERHGKPTKIQVHEVSLIPEAYHRSEAIRSKNNEPR